MRTLILGVVIGCDMQRLQSLQRLRLQVDEVSGILSSQTLTSLRMDLQAGRNTSSEVKNPLLGYFPSLLQLELLDVPSLQVIYSFLTRLCFLRHPTQKVFCKQCVHHLLKAMP